MGGHEEQPQTTALVPPGRARRAGRAVAPPIPIAGGGQTDGTVQAIGPAPSGTAPDAPPAVEPAPAQGAGGSVVSRSPALDRPPPAAPGGSPAEAMSEAGGAPVVTPAIIEAIALSGISRPAAAGEELGADGVIRVEHRDPALLAQLAEALAQIAGGGEPFGPLALPAPGAAAGGGAAAGRQGAAAGARSGQRRRGERAPIAPTAAANGAAAQQIGGGAGEEGADAATRWPTGPIVGYDQLSARELERLIEQILCDAEIMAAPAYPGLSRQRLRNAARQAGLEAHRFGRFSPWVELWLARAGVTARRVSTEGEWESPRPLQLEEKDEIRRALLRTPWPTRREIEEARAQGLGEGII